MIKASDSLKVYIEAQLDMGALAERLTLSRTHLYNILNGGRMGRKTAALIMKETGFSWDKAFITIDGKKKVKSNVQDRPTT